jgi:hypothetical protein
MRNEDIRGFKQILLQTLEFGLEFFLPNSSKLINYFIIGRYIQCLADGVVDHTTTKATVASEATMPQT